MVTPELLGGALLAAAVAAATVAVGPLITVGVVLVLFICALATWRWGRETPLLAVIVLAPLIPIAEGGSFGAVGTLRKRHPRRVDRARDRASWSGTCAESRPRRAPFEGPFWHWRR